MFGTVGRLGESRKAVAVLFIFLVLAVLVGMKAVDESFLRDFLKWVVPGWLIAHGWEEGQKARANGAPVKAPLG